MEENPDASIEASMFVDDYHPVEINNGDSMADSLAEDIDHALLFIQNHTFFQKCSINPNWILPHTGYSIGVFCNPSLLNNIHRLEKMTNINCNAVFVNVSNKVALPGYGLVWFNIYGITNILSMENSTNKFPITYDSIAGDKFILKKYS